MRFIMLGKGIAGLIVRFHRGSRRCGCRGAWLLRHVRPRYPRVDKQGRWGRSLERERWIFKGQSGRGDMENNGMIGVGTVADHPSDKTLAVAVYLNRF